MSLALPALDSPLLGRDVAPLLTASYDGARAADFTGADPGSFKHPRYQRLVHLPGPLGRAAYWAMELAGPWTHRLLALPPVRSTKALALCAAALAAVHARTGEAAVLAEGRMLLDRLQGLRHPDHGAWTVNFALSLPGGAARPEDMGLMNTLFSARAFWDWLVMTGDPALAEPILAAAAACVRLLPRHEDGDRLCFSYNPAARYFVHNANLQVAHLLVRAQTLDPWLGYGDLIRRAVAYSCDHILAVRSVPYAGPPSRRDVADNFHSGYVARSLKGILDLPAGADWLSGTAAEEAMDFVCAFHRRSFFDARGVYKFADRRALQTHSLAEALLMYAAFAPRHPTLYDDGFRTAVRAACDRLWDAGRGHFINQAYRLPLGLWRHDRTPMPRWSWSWMALALAVLAAVEAGDRRPVEGVPALDAEARVR